MPTKRRIEPWPIGLALALVSMISISLGFYAIAASRPDAEVVEDAYFAGLRFNEAAAARERARELGFELELSTRDTEHGVKVRAQARDANGASLPTESIRVRRVRPAEGGFDTDFELKASENGFAGEIPLPRPGRWQLVATAQLEDGILEQIVQVWR